MEDPSRVLNIYFLRIYRHKYEALQISQVNEKIIEMLKNRDILVFRDSPTYAEVFCKANSASALTNIAEGLAKLMGYVELKVFNHGLSDPVIDGDHLWYIGDRI